MFAMMNAVHHSRPGSPSSSQNSGRSISPIGAFPLAFNGTVEKWRHLLNIKQSQNWTRSADDKQKEKEFSTALKINNHTNVLQHIMTQLEDTEEQAVALVNIVMRILEAEYNKQNNSSINFIDAWTALEPVQNSKWLFFKQPKQDKILMELFSTKETDEDTWPAPTLINNIVEIMMPSPQAAANANAKAAIAKRAAAWEDFKKGASNNSGQFNAHGGRRTRRNRRNRRSTRSRR